MSSTLPATPGLADDPQLSPGLRRFFKVLGAIEYIGNKLPHPFWLFWILSGILAAVSWALSANGTAVQVPDSDEVVAVQNMLSAAGLQMIFGTAMENFAGFAPLPIIVTVIIGVAVAEKSGMLPALLRGTIVRLPAKWVTFAVAFAGMIAHVMFDAAFIVLLPLAALAFKAVGRSPILGIVVAYVAISAGYDASPVITPTDAILSSLSTSAAQIVDPEYVVSPMGNYFFSLASSVILAATITLVVELALKKRPDLDADPDHEDDDLSQLHMSAVEKRGLLASLAVMGGLILVVFLALLPSGSPLRGEGDSLVESLVFENIAVFIGLGFVLGGWTYGRITGSITKAGQVPGLMAEGIRTLAPVLVLFFAISQFLAYFRWTGIGTVVAVKGAESLKAGGLHPLLVLLIAMVLISFMNLIITSGSAMWSLLAPILIPMFMYIDIPPETTQAVYRIADSCTNAVTPMSAYFVLALGFMQKYRKSAGIGTLASFTIPLAFTMLVVWMVLFVVWWLLGIPLGPGAPIHW